MARILVTGAAGFIGSSLTDRLLADGFSVIGIDNFNNYYNSKIKEANLKNALKSKNFKLYKEDILDNEAISKIFKNEKPDKIAHLAARAGVRPSIKNPLLYAQVNVLGTVNLLKLAVETNVDQFIFGSSSSVYGQSRRLPFTEDDPCDAIISPYGSSKRSAEFFVESFNRTHGLRSTILRLFTVYGPRGRPDMSPALFTNAIINDKIINQFGDGLSSSDYTYVDDIIDGIVTTLDKGFDFEIINLGNNNPVILKKFIATLENVTGKKAAVKIFPLQEGDVLKTWASTAKARRILDWSPKVNIEEGLRRYVTWYRKTHKLPTTKSSQFSS